MCDEQKGKFPHDEEVFQRNNYSLRLAGLRSVTHWGQNRRSLLIIIAVRGSESVEEFMLAGPPAERIFKGARSRSLGLPCEALFFVNVRATVDDPNVGGLSRNSASHWCGSYTSSKTLIRVSQPDLLLLLLLPVSSTTDDGRKWRRNRALIRKIFCSSHKPDKLKNADI